VPRVGRLALSSLLGALSFAGAGCGSGLPLPTFPQLQEVGDIGEYGTERIRASDACRKSSTTMDGYLQCMDGKGWQFLTRTSVYPAPECWSLRTADDHNQLPTAQCFTRAAVPREAQRAPLAPAAAP
jgi:hypothetical protein